MKKVVFSFDDGLLDFYQVIFPILKKYNIKATLNVATGLVDKSVFDGFKYCSIDQIKEMQSYGIEMAIHSNFHTKNTTVSDLQISFDKLSSWIGNKNVSGVVIPYNIYPSKEILGWIKTNNLTYIRGDEVSKYNFLHKMFVFLHLTKKSNIFAKQNSKIYKIKNVNYIPSIDVWMRRDAEYFIKLISKMPKHSSLTLMFHSICNCVDEVSRCAYPEGAWLVDRFEKLIEWLISNGYQICTQIEAIK